METRLTLCATLAFAGALVACRDSATAPRPELSAMTTTAEVLPFNAKLAGNAHLSPTNDPCVFRNEETGSGAATHLGHFAWRDVESVNFCTLPGGVAVAGSFVMTAANGDKLAGDFTTTGTFAANGDLHIQGAYTFTGGTGRFLNAAGSGDLHVTGLPSPALPFSGTFNGTIRF